jgi:hypothetical protein
MVICGDKVVEELREHFENGKMKKVRNLLDSYRTTKGRYRKNSFNCNNAVTREMASISIDSNTSDGNYNYNSADLSGIAFDGFVNRANRSMSNSSWMGLNIGGSMSTSGGGILEGGRNGTGIRAGMY